MPGAECVLVCTSLVEQNGEWRLVPALLLQKYSTEETRLVFATSDGALRFESMRHLSHRISAEAWLYLHEFEQIAAEIEKDWRGTGRWPRAYGDVLNIRAQIQKAQMTGSKTEDADAAVDTVGA